VTRYLPRLLVLAGLWLLAWGDLSVGTLLSGLVLAAVLLISFPPESTDSSIRVRPLGVLALLAYIGRQLVTSNVLVARQILSREARVRTGVLAYDLTYPSDEVITLMANVIGLTPGTMTVEATRHPHRIYVHFLLLDDVDTARRGVERLERLVVGAIEPRSRPAATGGGPGLGEGP
jgi:multicomponent Na+:H+ antiporter subunit E